MDDRISDERLDEIIREDATQIGCDSTSSHEVGQLARELYVMRQATTYEEALSAIPEADRDALIFGTWPTEVPKYYNPVNSSRGNGDTDE